MTHHTTPPLSPDGPEDDGPDQAWWDRLAGRAAGAPDDPSLMQADQWGEALRAMDRDMQLQQETPAALEAEAHQRQRLQFALKAQARPSGPSRWRTWGTWGSVAVAASLLMFMVMPQRPRSDALDDGFVLRGDEPVQEIVDAQPLARAQAMATSLRSSKLVVRAHTGQAIAVLEIEVPPEDFEALKPALVQAGVTPRAGLVLVRIHAP